MIPLRKGRHYLTVHCPSWIMDGHECGQPIPVSIIVRSGGRWDLEDWASPSNCHGNTDEGCVDAITERVSAILQDRDHFDERGEA